VFGAVILLMSLILLGCGGSAASRGSQAFAGPHIASMQHIVSVAPDINMIMATGACKPGSMGG
jgi:hypothetical protein